MLLLNGPSLNLLGEREPERYGRTTLDEIETRVASAAEAAGMTLVDSFQSNHEGDLIDRLHVRDFSWLILQRLRGSTSVPPPRATIRPMPRAAAAPPAG
ncbi:MAG: type II 3-dehydroquinate dehydratase, partial [Candidatus Limnocylindrus sp.]